MPSSSDHLKMVRTLEAENEARRYCKTCNSVKLSVTFIGATCGDCVLGVVAETASADPEGDRRAVKQAVITLIKNHRAEFDHLITEEKKKASLVNETDDNTWVEWKRDTGRKR